MSVVIQCAISAFTAAVENPLEQPSLSTLRQHQKVLFSDVAATLRELPCAPELRVRPEVDGQPYLFTNEVLQRWLRKWPQGVMWPITVVAEPEVENLAMPFRVLLMVPVGASTSGMDVARARAGRLAGVAWPNRSEESLGKGAVLFWGMRASSDGRWDFAPAALWTLPGVDEFVESVGLLLMPGVVPGMTAGDLEQVAVLTLARAYLADDIGIVIHSDR